MFGTTTILKTSEIGDERERRQIKSALRDVLSDDFNLTLRAPRQIDRSDAILGNFNLRDEDGSEYPLHEPTGDKTRKTYDFTSESRTKFTEKFSGNFDIGECKKNPLFFSEYVHWP